VTRHRHGRQQQGSLGLQPGRDGDLPVDVSWIVADFHSRISRLGEGGGQFLGSWRLGRWVGVVIWTSMGWSLVGAVRWPLETGMLSLLAARSMSMVAPVSLGVVQSVSEWVIARPSR